MDGLDRTLQDRIARAAAEMSARPLRNARRDLTPRSTLRPLLAAVALLGVIAGAGAAVGLHQRPGARHSVAPAVSPPAAPSPVARTPQDAPPWQATPFVDAVMAWDSTHQQLVAFQSADVKGGSRNGTMWTWDGIWHSLSTDAGPVSVAEPILVDMPALHGVALLDSDVIGVGSTSIGGSWLWDGRAWHALPRVGFPDCMGPTTAAWDAKRRAVVVIVSNRCSGGQTVPPSETWDWDGRTWHRGPDLAGGDQDPVVTWDAGADAVVLLAGQPSGSAAGTAREWMWTGSGWRATAASRLAYPRVKGTAWDSSVRAVVLYGLTDVGTESGPVTLAVRNGVWSAVPTDTYPARVLGITEDTLTGRLVALGEEPIAISQTPAPYNDAAGYFVLTLTPDGWRHVGYAELTAKS